MVVAACGSFLALGVPARAATPTPKLPCEQVRPSNGTGWNPGSSAGSLASTNPRPGPDLLYWPAPRAPQLENTGIWRATPIMISGASAYRRGEFLYQDFLYDDTGLGAPGAFPGPRTPSGYPSDSAIYGGNAADLVEFRVKLEPDALVIRLTYNTMLDPSVAATTIALGSSTAPHAVPHNAGASMPAAVFVTVHGCTADAVTAADGKTWPEPPDVAIDRERRQVEVRVRYAAFDPRGQSAVRVGAATGLWDAASNQYLRPDSTKPAFFNVAFRFGEPFTDFRDSEQAAALASGDLGRFFALIDFEKLAAGLDDEMNDRRTGVPTSGMMSRIYASHFETVQGRGTMYGTTGNATVSHTPCAPPSCSPEYAGQLQRYSMYVPERPPPARWGLTLYHHGCNENYNSFIGRAARFAELDGGTSLAVTTESRSTCMWEFDQVGADLYEVWADVARNHPLDPDRATLSGQSLGGYATWKNIVQFPDLFAASAPIVGPPAAEATYSGPLQPPRSGEGTLIYDLLPSLRWVPVIHWVALQDELVPFTATKPISDKLALLGYRHSLRAFTGNHGRTGNNLANYDPMGQYIANRRVVRDPAHVTYVFSAFMHQPQYGLTSDHAYWLSDIRLRSNSGAAPIGSIDAFSHALGTGDPPPRPPHNTTGMYDTADAGPVPYIGIDLDWDAPPTAPRHDQLDIRADNVASVTVWAARAGLSCHPRVNVVSDAPVEVKIVGCEEGRPVRCTKRSRLTVRLPKGRLTRVDVRVNGRRTKARRSGRRLYVDVRRWRGAKARVVVRVRIRRGGVTRSRVVRRTARICAG